MGTDNIYHAVDNPRSIFDLLADPGDLDWRGIYASLDLYVDEIGSGVDGLKLTAHLYPELRYDPRFSEVLEHAKEALELARELRASAYARREEQRERQEGART